ncbi:RmlC-like cupin [Coleophoma cylindrospora]|uniref:RmlC-like cupin n=1 Tax=Coleophoma cylindrospora TaxID=1849047 RepID=A0A3D8SG40_9HELO|nr:RmlC-like cupin [Coleophoma cylindrospora]
MRFSSFTSYALLAPLAACSSIWVTEVPDYVRPYAIPQYQGRAVSIGDQVYRFPVTGPASGGAFTLLGTNAPASTSLGVLPHLHERHYENFFNFKGRFQLWSQYGNETQQTRILGPGDYGGVPENTIHTFQILDPDTEMTGIICPGGFEDLFYALANANYTSSTLSPYNPYPSNASSTPSASVISQLTSFDVYAELSFVERSDAVNGAAPNGSVWRTGANAISSDSIHGAFIAKDYGPKYLYSGPAKGSYQVIQPFVTGLQSAGNYTLSTITLDKGSSATAPTLSFPGHAAFEVLDGKVIVNMLNETVELLSGDVVFIPGNTTYSYYGGVAYNKFLHISQGEVGLDVTMMADSISWDSPVWPTS